MAQLTIIKGEEFRITVKDKIEKSDIFLHQYQDAALKLNEIINVSVTGNEPNLNNEDYENNMIAFCGERGDGKSSAMMTFIQDICNHMEKHKRETEDMKILPYSEDTMNTYFTPPVLIDPSLFDNVHNVLDVLLAKIFQSFRSKFNENNQCIDSMKREKMIDQFQVVYKYVSLINDEKKMLDDEYDYEGNISKLMKLGASTNLKSEMKKLVDMYLEFMQTYEGKPDHGQQYRKLIIALDDLDLSSNGAYKMAEQIRKYMVLPNVVVIMALKIEQLKLCVEESNYRQFKMLLENNKNPGDSNELKAEISTMAERYVSKLVPKARRIYLPSVKSFRDVTIVCLESKKGRTIWNSSNQKDIEQAVLDMIYEKTGMLFLKGKRDEKYLLPSTLRETVNMLSILTDMKYPSNNRDVIRRNIESFVQYWEKSWLYNNLPQRQADELKQMMDLYFSNLHANARLKMDDLLKASGFEHTYFYVWTHEQAESYCIVTSRFLEMDNWFYTKQNGSYEYGIKVLYTIKLNELLNNKQFYEMSDFIGGYIWGGGFSYVIPAVDQPMLDRSRFVIRTMHCMNQIMKYMYGEEWTFYSENKNSIVVKSIPKNEERIKHMIAWSILGILGNTFLTNKDSSVVLGYQTSMIFDNSYLLNNIHLSIENFFVSLCNIRKVFDKVNMNILGISRDEFDLFAGEFETLNKESISCARLIATNVDLALELKNYCFKNRDYKNPTESNKDRSEKLILRFFDNVAKFMEQQGIEISSEQLNCLNVPAENAKKGDETEAGVLKIRINELYAEMIEQSLNDPLTAHEVEKLKEKETFLNDFRNRLTVPDEAYNNKLPAGIKSAQKKSAKNIKEKFDILADNIRVYAAKYNTYPKALNVDQWCALYGEVITLYLEDEAKEVPGNIISSYNQIAGAVKSELKRAFDEQMAGNNPQS